MLDWSSRRSATNWMRSQASLQALSTISGVRYRSLGRLDVVGRLSVEGLGVDIPEWTKGERERDS